MYRVVFNNVSLRYQISNFESTDGAVRRYVNAAQDVSFELFEGDRVGVIGRNGSGKSTLLSLTAGNILPQSGSVSVEGERLALINRASGLEPRATMKENAFLRGYSYKLNGSDLEQFVDSVLSDSGLSSRANSSLNTLSTGMLGRFNIALNTQMVKPITILDEWIGTLDISSNDGNTMLNKLSAEAKIVMLASHNKILVKQLCNRVLLLEQGHIIFDGSDLESGFEMLSTIMQIDSQGQLSTSEIKAELDRLDREAREKAAREKAAQEKLEREKAERKKTEREKAEYLEVQKKEKSRLENIQMELQKQQQLLQKSIQEAANEPLHFINIGRTYIPSIRRALDKCKITKYKLIFHPITKRLVDIPKGEKICLIYRDPMSRFVSGFYSRKCQGAPDFDVPWTKQEESTFSNFSSPSNLLESLISKNSSTSALAFAAIRETEYLNKSLCWYFGDAQNLLTRIDDLFFVANCENLLQLVSELGFLLDCELESSMLGHEEKYVLNKSEPINENAKNIFLDIFGYEYELYGFLGYTEQQKNIQKESK